MSETLNVKRVGKSKFGFYLLVEGEEKDEFKSTSEAVSKFLEKRTPCEIEVTEKDEKGGITRVKVISGNAVKKEQEEEVEVQKIGSSDIKPANDYKESYWDWKKENDIKNQEKITNQFAVRESLRMIEVNNQFFPDNKILITKNNVFSHAVVIKSILEQLENMEQ